MSNKCTSLLYKCCDYKLVGGLLNVGVGVVGRDPVGLHICLQIVRECMKFGQSKNFVKKKYTL